MQKIKVAEVKEQPTRTGGQLIIITDEKNARFSGFLKELHEVKSGDLIEAEIQVDGKYNNITAVKILEHGNPPASNGKSRNGDERRSIERQVAVKVAAQLNPDNVNKLIQDAEVIAMWIASEPLDLGQQTQKESEPEKKSNVLNRVSGIDMDWLQESLGKLRQKSDVKYNEIINRLTEISGKSAKSVSEAVGHLNAKQASEWVKELQGILDSEEVS